jgi:hypothetical protein
MRTFATILNVALLAAVVYLLFTQGIPASKDLWIVALIGLTPVASLVALRLGGAQDWFSLVLQRKALEEKKKIEELQRKP